MYNWLITSKLYYPLALIVYSWLTFSILNTFSRLSFGGNQSLQGLQRMKSRIEDIQINQALVEHKDSLDVSVQSN